MSERREIYGVDYNNNTVDVYVLTESGKYEKVKSMELVKISEAKEIMIYKEDLSTTTISLDENTKVVYINGFEVAYVLQNNVYALVEDEDAWIELEQTHGIPENQKVTEKNGTLYDLVKNGEVKLGTLITGYEANGYSGEWMIYALTTEGVKIAPYYNSWNVTYEYQTQKTNSENLTNITNECEKYLNSNLAIEAIILEKAEINSIYNFPGSTEGTRNHFYKIYAKENDKLIAVNSFGYPYEIEIETNEEIRIVPVITLDKDVKITAGEYTGKIYK